jgi:alkanesulfonate monooxygenase SsuD/methylene tetrahydromethanopterin reductase-like flavin-dependent oxidoreductase (luciferase family)
MATLDFAFWDVLPHSATGTAIADDYDEHIRLAQRLEAFGWHSYFVIEHQNAPQGVSAPAST